MLDEAVKEEATRLYAAVPISQHKVVKVQTANEERSITDLLRKSLLENLLKERLYEDN